MVFTGRVYDFLKNLALIYLPALGTLYFGLAPFWHFPNVEEVTGSILVIDTVLGGVLGLSSKSYNKDKYVGTINITETEDKKILSFDLGENAGDFDQKSEVTFKIEKA